MDTYVVDDVAVFSMLGLAFVQCTQDKQKRLLTLVYDELDGIELKSFLTAKDGRIYQVGTYNVQGEEIFILRNERFMQGRWNCIKSFKTGKEA